MVGGAGWATRGTAGQLSGRAGGPSGPFLNRPFHTTPTPSTPRKQAGGEPAKEEDERAVNSAPHPGRSRLFVERRRKLELPLLWKRRADGLR